MTFYILIDAVLVGLLSVFALKGIKMGLALSAATALTLIIAFFGARLITDTFSPHFAGVFEPMVSAWVENKAGLQWKTAGAVPGFSLTEFLNSLGISERLAAEIAGGVKDRIAQAGESIGRAVSGSLSLAVARCFTFTVSFLTLALLLYTAARMLDAVAKLPILNLLNKLGGLAGGVAAGAIVLYIAIGAFDLLGFMDPELFNQTYLLKLYMSFMENRI